MAGLLIPTPDDGREEEAQLVRALRAAARQLSAYGLSSLIDALAESTDTSRPTKRPLDESRRSLLLSALFVAAGELAPTERRELADLLAHDAALAEWNPDGDKNPLADRARPYAEALLSVAQLLGRAPTSSDYTGEYERRRDRVEPMPSPAAIVKFFGSWAIALEAAGLRTDTPRGAWGKRLRYGWKRYPEYPTARLIECLRESAAALGRTPSVRDYTAWRDHMLGGEAGRRLPLINVPHWRTMEHHFGSWNAALRAAGFTPRKPRRRPGGSRG